MRKVLLGVMGVWLCGTTHLVAQPVAQPAPTSASAEVQDPNSATARLPVIDMCLSADPAPYRIWAQSEYLLWWVKNTPLPVPLVTTGDPHDGFPLVNAAGAIGQPATRVLLGDSNTGFGAFSGMRATLGAWLDENDTVGLEGSGFLLERRTNRFAAGSDALGNPPLYFPGFNVVAGAERGNPISDPLRQFSGDVAVTSSLQLWGAELNGALNVWRRPGLEVTVLAGFRYADLLENLQIQNTTNDLLFLNTTVANDHFGTRNQFYGGQLGTRVSLQRERWSVAVTTKIALGATHELVNIEGAITQFGPGAFAPGTFPGGIYAQPTNMGQRTANQFSVLPAAELKLAYQVTPRLRATIGYDFMYWNQVVRPGSQIDHNINQSQSPIFGGGALVGPASPAPLFNRTDFWAQGVNFGLEFRY